MNQLQVSMYADSVGSVWVWVDGFGGGAARGASMSWMCARSSKFRNDDVDIFL